MNDNELATALRGLDDTAETQEESPKRVTAEKTRFDFKAEREAYRIPGENPNFVLHDGIYLIVEYTNKKVIIADAQLDFCEVAHLRDLLTYLIEEKGIGGEAE